MANIGEMKRVAAKRGYQINSYTGINKAVATVSEFLTVQDKRFEAEIEESAVEKAYQYAMQQPQVDMQEIEAYLEERKTSDYGKTPELGGYCGRAK